MNRRSVAAAFVLCAIVLVAGSARGGEARASEVRSLEYLVDTPAGSVEYHFEVRADSAAAAAEAAEQALAELAPRAPFHDLDADIRGSDDSVTAAYAPWPWRWADAELPVATWYNASGAPTGVIIEMIAGALAQWSAVPGSSFGFALRGETDAPPGIAEGVADGINVIGWKSLSCAGGCVLGVTSKLPETHEVDIVLNSNPEARLGDGSPGTIDTMTVLLHEAGHMAGLEHSCPAFVGACTEAERNAVMYFRYQGVAHDLQPDDMAGIRALYPAPSLHVSLLPVAPSPLSVSVVVRPGWNLVILPGGAIESVAEALPCVQAIFQWENGSWQVWRRGAPASENTLRSIAGISAAWVLAATACNG